MGERLSEWGAGRLSGAAGAHISYLRIIPMDEIKQELSLDAGQALATLRKLDEQFANFEKRLKSTAQTLGQYSSKGKDLAKGLDTQNKGLKQSAQQVQRLTVDWKTMVRIVTTQAIVRALSTLRNAIKASVGDAADFAKRIAEIGTISDESAKLISSSVLDMSDQFSVALDTMAEAKYQVISNSFAGVAEQVDVLNAALKFSKVAVTEADASVNLITGTLNAFGKGSSEAADVAAALFETIRLGRTRGAELANSLGQVLPVASELGAELSEVLAALSATTTQGQKTTRATTALRSLFTGLVKPSEEMAKTLKQMGYESGQALIKAEGLGGALKKLREEAGGTVESMGRLWPNVRGLTSALALSSSAAEKYANDLAQIESAARATLDRKYGEVMSTSVQQVQRDLNRLRNFFVSDFGATILESTNQVLQWTGGADNAIRMLESFSGPATVAVAGLGAMGLAMGAASIRAKLLAADMGLLSKSVGVLGGALAAYAVGDYLGRSLHDWITQHDRMIQDSNQRIIEFRASKVAAEHQLEEKKLRDILRLERQHLADQRKLYFQRVDDLQVVNATLLQDTSYYLSQVVTKHRRALSEIERAYQEAGKNILQSDQRIQTAQDQLDDAMFKQRLDRMSESERARAKETRALILASEAASKLARGEEDALKQFDRARSLTDNARILAAILDKQVTAEKEYQRVQRRTAKNSQEQAKAASDQLQTMEGLKRSILEGFKAGDLEGAGKALKEFLELGGEGLALEKLRITEDAFVSLHKQLDDAAQDFVLPVRLKLEGILPDFDFDPSNLDQAYDALLQKQKEGLEIDARRKRAADELAGANRRAAEALKQIEPRTEVSTLRRIGDVLLGGKQMTGQKLAADETALAVNKLRESFVQMSQSAISQEGVKQLAAQLAAVQKHLSPIELTHYSEALSALDLKAKSISQLELIGKGNLTAVRQFADEMSRAADEAARVKQGLSAGGPVYHAAGGPMGTDTVPAWLSPGEFVVNAKASRQFASQLIAMNSGAKPIYREAGGIVNNDNSVTVGDVNIQGQTQPIGPRDIARAIDRERRKRTIRQ